MGQRTTIILQHIIRKEGELSSDAVDTRVFYEQWGIGRITPTELMTIVQSTITGRPGRYGYAELSKPVGMYDNTPDYDTTRLNSLDFTRPEDVGRVMLEEGNNNGGVFVRIVNDRYGHVESIEYAYMKGSEEGGDYTQWCTEDEWMKAFDRYCDFNFYKMYRQVMGYFGAKEYSV